jgi:hypothetical protein
MLLHMEFIWDNRVPALVKVIGIPKYKSWCLEMIQDKEECTYHGDSLVCKLVADESGK